MKKHFPRILSFESNGHLPTFGNTFFVVDTVIFIGYLPTKLIGMSIHYLRY